MKHKRKLTRPVMDFLSELLDDLRASEINLIDEICQNKELKEKVDELKYEIQILEKELENARSK